MLVYKSPSEQFGVSLDFTGDLGAGNTIASIVSVTAANRVTGVDATTALIGTPAPAIDPDGTSVDLTLQGGAAGADYTVSITITSSIGETYVGEILLKITGGAYTTVDAVCGMFGTFVRNGPKGPSDGQIQAYIDDVGSEIDAVLERRFGEAIALMPGANFAAQFAAWVDAFTQDQQNLVEKVNRFGACGEMGTVFAATGQLIFMKLAESYEAKYQAMLRELDGRDEKGNPKQDGGRYDKLFDPAARTPSPRPVLESFHDRGPRRETEIDDFVSGDWNEDGR
jgi:hypothetical protein